MVSWLYESFFYHIYPLGFCGAPLENDFHSQPVNRISCISEWIPHMQQLGINALYLGPIFESSAHGYDTADYYKIDRRLGTNQDFTQIVKELHQAGIKVILDGVFNHVGRNFWAFQDILQHRGHSMHCDWIHGLNFNGSNCYNDPFSYSGWEGHFNLVKLNLHNSYVKEHIFNAIKEWVHQFNIDGLRLDVAYCLDKSFLHELRNFCNNLKPDFLLLGEVLHGDYKTWANPGMLHTVTNYDIYKGLFSGHNDNNYHEFASNLARQFDEYGLYKEFGTYNFADNHDVNRIASTLKNKAHLYPLYAVLMTMPGCPSVYYGSEFGLEGTKNNGCDTALRPDINTVRNPENHTHKDLAEALKRFAQLRKNSHALKYGRYKQIGVSSLQLAFVRQSEHESVIVAINGSDQPARLECYNVPITANRGVDILNNDGATYQINQNRTIIDNIPPYWARVLKAC